MSAAKNIAASVRQKLLNKARTEKRPFAELLQYYAMERFLARLSQSPHAQSFILKGALMLRVWKSSEFRPTMDIDMLGISSNDKTNIVAMILDVIHVEVEPDGLNFDIDSIKSESITEEADYQGIRIRFLGTLDSARVNMQIDIGFGDIIYPEPEISEMPPILDFAAPNLLCYSRESAIAEKFEAMVKLGILNSRMKDFFDIWLLSRQFNFNGNDLAKAINLTFEKRGTSIENDVIAFQETFIKEKQIQWTAFRKRLDQEYLPKNFADIINSVAGFLNPIVEAVRQNRTFERKWIAADSWQ